MDELASLASPSLAVTESTGLAGAMAREKYEIESQMQLALAHPRDERTCMQHVVTRCQEPRFAETAIYRYPRGGSEILGPSVGMAREIGRRWRHIRSGFRVLAVGNGQIHIQGFAHDVEANVLRVEEAKVSSRVFRKGEYVDLLSQHAQKVLGGDVDRTMRELCGRHGATLERNCILRVVPSDLVDIALMEATKTADRVARGELDADRDVKIKTLLTKLGGLGVTREMVEEKLGKKEHLITPDEFVALVQIGASLKDGNSVVEDHFNVPQKEAPTDAPPAGTAWRRGCKVRAPPGPYAGDPGSRPVPCEGRSCWCRYGG